jgi:hypothetical protein
VVTRRPPASHGGSLIVFVSCLCVTPSSSPNGFAYSMALVLSARPINSGETFEPETRTNSLTAARTAV